MGFVKEDVRRLMAWTMLAFQYIAPWRYQTRSTHQRYFNIVGNISLDLSYFFRSRDFYLSENFGELEYIWPSAEINSDGFMIVRVLDGESGSIVIEKKWPLKSLDMKSQSHLNSHHVCSPHRGSASAFRLFLGYAGTFMVALFIFLSKPIFTFIFLRMAFRWVAYLLRPHHNL